MSINNSYLLPTTERQTAPLLPAAERRPAPPPADRWRNTSRAAFASVRDYTIEGLCLHARALHPEFFWSPGEETDQADLLATAVWPAEHDAIPQSQRAMVTVKDLWPDEPDDHADGVLAHGRTLGLVQWGPADESLPWDGAIQAGAHGSHPSRPNSGPGCARRGSAGPCRSRPCHALDDRTLKDMGLAGPPDRARRDLWTSLALICAQRIREYWRVRYIGRSVWRRWRANLVGRNPSMLPRGARSRRSGRGRSASTWRHSCA